MCVRLYRVHIVAMRRDVCRVTAWSSVPFCVTDSDGNEASERAAIS